MCGRVWAQTSNPARHHCPSLATPEGQSLNYCECSRPAGDGRYLCETCAGELGRALGQVPGLIRELGTTAARLDQVKVGTSIESKSASKHAPDPVNFSAIACADQMRRHVGGYTVVDAEPIAQAAGGPQFKRGLDRLISRAYKIIDREPERQHLGPCPTQDCGQPMNPIKGERHHHCTTCGQTTDIAEHQNQKLGAAWAVTARPPQLVPVLAALGVRVTVKNIRNWKLLGHLQPAGQQDGHPTYTVADVYDVANRMAARRKKTAA